MIEFIEVDCYFVVLNFNNIMYTVVLRSAHNIISASTMTPFQFLYKKGVF
jgi:predicted glycosyltransferase involved in capsule biosynthesis